MEARSKDKRGPNKYQAKNVWKESLGTASVTWDHTLQAIDSAAIPIDVVQVNAAITSKMNEDAMKNGLDHALNPEEYCSMTKGFNRETMAGRLLNIYRRLHESSFY